MLEWCGEGRVFFERREMKRSNIIWIIPILGIGILIYASIEVATDNRKINNSHNKQIVENQTPQKKPQIRQQKPPPRQYKSIPRRTSKAVVRKIIPPDGTVERLRYEVSRALGSSNRGVTKVPYLEVVGITIKISPQSFLYTQHYQQD